MQTVPTTAAAPTPTLFIDADACPVTREALDIARRRGIHTVIAGNSTQNLQRRIRRDDPATPRPHAAAFG